MSEKNCLSCDYCFATTRIGAGNKIEIGAKNYHCQYNPPVPVVVGVNQTGPVIMPLFPPVNAEMACSHHSEYEAPARMTGPFDPS